MFDSPPTLEPSNGPPTIVVATHPSTASPTIIISTLSALADFLAHITPCTTLYLDLEGANLSRHGTLTLLTAHLQPYNTTYLIDVQTLGSATFTTPASSTPTLTHPHKAWPLSPPHTPPSTSQLHDRHHHEHQQQQEQQRTLKTILEDASIEKCLWDARADADALWWLHGVRLAGVFDLQLLEFLTRPVWRRGRFVRGLARCVEADLVPSLSAAAAAAAAGLATEPRRARAGAGCDVGDCVGECDAEEWLAVKRAVKAGLAGDGDVFAARPLEKKTVQYCVGDVVLLPRLRAVYMRRAGVGLGTTGLVLKESGLRMEAAMGEGFQRGQQDMALGPAVAC